MMAKGGMTDDTYVNIFLSRGFDEKRGSMGLRFFEHKPSGVFITYDSKGNQTPIIISKDKTGEKAIYEGNSIQEVVESLDNLGIEQMKKGGDVQGKQTDKAKDGQRFAKPKGWRWKDEALEKVGRVKMSKSPSKFMRKKYPELVYWEDRIDKSDKNPSRKYISN